MKQSWVRLAVIAILLAVAGGRLAVQWIPLRPVSVAGRSEAAVALRKTLASVRPSDRVRLAEVYEALALAVEAGKVQTTEQLMVGTGHALDLAFGGRKLRTDVDVGAAVDAVVEAAIGGRPMVPITDANSASVVRGLREVVWACGG